MAPASPLRLRSSTNALALAGLEWLDGSQTLGVASTRGDHGLESTAREATALAEVEVENASPKSVGLFTPDRALRRRECSGPSQHASPSVSALRKRHQQAAAGAPPLAPPRPDTIGAAASGYAAAAASAAACEPTHAALSPMMVFSPSVVRGSGARQCELFTVPDDADDCLMDADDAAFECRQLREECDAKQQRIYELEGALADVQAEKRELALTAELLLDVELRTVRDSVSESFRSPTQSVASAHRLQLLGSPAVAVMQQYLHDHHHGLGHAARRLDDGFHSRSPRCAMTSAARSARASAAPPLCDMSTSTDDLLPAPVAATAATTTVRAAAAAATRSTTKTTTTTTTTTEERRCPINMRKMLVTSRRANKIGWLSSKFLFDDVRL